MNLHKLTNAGLIIIVFVLSVLTALKIAPKISELRESGMQTIIYYDPKYRALSFLYNTSIALAVMCGLLLAMIFGSVLSNKYSEKRIYKILTGLLVAAVLVLSVFVVFFTSDTVITDPDADKTISLAGNNSEPFGKTKPYYLMGLFAGIIGILSTGSIWLGKYL